MDNTEVNLFQIAQTIWEKKKQILFFTFLIVICAVLFRYVQPVYYEAHRTAYILSYKNKVQKLSNNWPAEFYESFSKNTEILNAVLKRLPKTLKFGNNSSPLEFLSKHLQVQYAYVPAFGHLSLPAIKLVFTSRHTNSISAHQILNVWKSVLETHFAEMELHKISESEKQLKLNIAKWNRAKKRLTDFNESFYIRNKKLELDSKMRIISRTHSASEALVQQMDSSAIIDATSRRIAGLKGQLSGIEEKYLAEKGVLREYNRLLTLQPKMLNLSEEYNSRFENSRTSNLNDPKGNKVLNPIYMKLQEKVIDSEVLLKRLDAQKAHLEQMINHIKINLSSQNPGDEVIGFAEKKHQLEILAKKIKQYEKESTKLENQILEKTVEKRTLEEQESELANLVKLNSKEFEDLQSVKAQNTLGLSFEPSTSEPGTFVGTSLIKIAVISFGSGLIFMVLVTLIKVNFRARFENEQPKDTLNSDAFSRKSVLNEPKPENRIQ